MLEPSARTDEASARVEVRRSARRRKTISAHREGETIVVDIPAALSRADEARLVPPLVAKVLAAEAARRPPRGDAELRARADRLAAEFLDPQAGRAVRAHDVRWVTNQHRRWGSCTAATGEIRLSAALQEMPAWVVDYVLLHELAHLVEPNHSARFHRLLAPYPQLERAKGYLAGYSDARRLGMAED